MKIKNIKILCKNFLNNLNFGHLDYDFDLKKNDSEDYLYVNDFYLYNIIMDENVNESFDYDTKNIKCLKCQEIIGCYILNANENNLNLLDKIKLIKEKIIVNEEIKIVNENYFKNKQNSYNFFNDDINSKSIENKVNYFNDFHIKTNEYFNDNINLINNCIKYQKKLANKNNNIINTLQNIEKNIKNNDLKTINFLKNYNFLYNQNISKKEEKNSNILENTNRLNILRNLNMSHQKNLFSKNSNNNNIKRKSKKENIKPEKKTKKK